MSLKTQEFKEAAHALAMVGINHACVFKTKRGYSAIIYANGLRVGGTFKQGGVVLNIVHKTYYWSHNEDDTLGGCDEILQVKRQYEKYNIPYYYVMHNTEGVNGAFNQHYAKMRAIYLSNLHWFPICSDVTRLIISYIK